MAESKTRPTKESVADFINAVEPEQRQADARELCAFIQKITGEEPVLWASGIIGFGQYHYVYESGTSGDAPCIGMAPRKTKLTVYVMAGFELYPEIMEKLGKYKTGKSCLHIKKLSDIDLDALGQLIQASNKTLAERYPQG